MNIKQKRQESERLTNKSSFTCEKDAFSKIKKK